MSVYSGFMVQAEKGIVPITLPVRSLFVVRCGLAAWVIALIVIWVVPALHEGDRAWWPWVPVAALVVGLIGHAYVARGRGNASEA